MRDFLEIASWIFLIMVIIIVGAAGVSWMVIKIEERQSASPCEDFKDYRLQSLPARCLEFYKVK